MPTKQDAINALSEMSPVRRAAQLAADTITNFANKATFGGVGALGDLARGVPIGTTGDQISGQLTAASPFAQAASSGLGMVAPIGGVVSGGKAAVGLARNALFEDVGARAAALGLKSGLKPGVKTVLKAAAIPAAVAGTAGYLTSDPGPAAAAPAKAPAKAAPTNPIDAALAAGASSTSPDAATAVQNYIANVFGGKGGVTAREAMAASQTAPLLEAATKPGQTTKNIVLGNTADLSRQIYQNEVTQAQELAKSDPAAAQKVVEKATTDYFQRNAGLVGFDPSRLVQAQLLQGDGEQ